MKTLYLTSLSDSGVLGLTSPEDHDVFLVTWINADGHQDVEMYTRRGVRFDATYDGLTFRCEKGEGVVDIAQLLQNADSFVRPHGYRVYPSWACGGGRTAETVVRESVADGMAELRESIDRTDASVGALRRELLVIEKALGIAFEDEQGTRGT